jgi:hypothetical protein
MGRDTTATGFISTALGEGTTASGRTSTAIGREIEAAGDYSVAIALNDQNGAVVSQDNTMAVMGGNVGIGTTSPSAKLDVVGDAEITGNLTITGSSMARFRAYNSVSDDVADSYNKVEFDTEVYDDGGHYSTTNDRFTAPTDGVYHFDVQVGLVNLDSGTRVIIVLYKNGNAWRYVDQKYSDGQTWNIYGGSADLKLNSGDYIEVYVFSSDTTTTHYGNIQYTNFNGHRVY